MHRAENTQLAEVLDKFWSSIIGRQGMHRSALLGALIACALACGAPAQAHHAVQAQFDVTKNVILVGILKRVDWQNPHAWFHFEVKNVDGTVTVWSLETVEIGRASCR